MLAKGYGSKTNRVRANSARATTVAAGPFGLDTSLSHDTMGPRCSVTTASSQNRAKLERKPARPRSSRENTERARATCRPHSPSAMRPPSSSPAGSTFRACLTRVKVMGGGKVAVSRCAGGRRTWLKGVEETHLDDQACPPGAQQRRHVDRQRLKEAIAQEELAQAANKQRIPVERKRRSSWGLAAPTAAQDHQPPLACSVHPLHLVQQ